MTEGKDGFKDLGSIIGGLNIEDAKRRRAALADQPEERPVPPEPDPNQLSFFEDGDGDLRDSITLEELDDFQILRARRIMAAVEQRERELEAQRRLEDESRIADEEPEPGSPNAAMKQILTNQIRSGTPWNPLFLNDGWVHFSHDFVEGGLLAQISGGALKVLLAMKTRTNKETGLVRINQTHLAEHLKMSARQMRRYISELTDSNHIRQIDTPEAKGHGITYQVIEHIRMYDAMATEPAKETVVNAAFPYVGKNYRDVTAMARSFAKTGNMPPPKSMELTPLKSPHLTPVQPLTAKQDVPAAVVEQQNVVNQTIHLHVNGDVNAPININTAGVSIPSKNEKERPTPEINMPDGSGNPLVNALKKVKPRQPFQPSGGDPNVIDVEPKG